MIYIHKGRMAPQKSAQNWDIFDLVAFGVGTILIIALACASVYGMRYSAIEEEHIPGFVGFKADGKGMYSLQINDDMTARAKFSLEQIDGSLKLVGATTDTVVYQFRDIEISGKSEIDDAIVFIRIPRTGLQGDLSGKWMIYFHSDELKTDLSYWVFAYPDGSAMSTYRKKTNAIVQQDYRLLEWSKEYVWTKNNNVLVMTSAEKETSE